MNNQEFKPGIYRHYKGNNYKALFMATHTETTEVVVVYQALYGDRDFWVRPASMWNEFVEIDGKKVRRFELIESAEDDND